MSQYDEYQLSPSPFEKNNNIPSDKELSFQSSTISRCSFLSKITDDSSLSSTNNHQFAGATPKKYMAKNSLELLKNKSIQEYSQSYENESNEAISVLKSLIDENIISLQREREINDSQASTMMNFINDNNDNKINSIPSSQYVSNQSENSYKTIDSYHDSDVDMFEDFNSPEINTANEPLNLSYPKCLADHSSEFFHDKSYFSPENNCSPCVNLLIPEIYDVSMDEIQHAVEYVIALLEMPEEKSE